MSIRNFDDIHSIRKELRRLKSDCDSNNKIIASVKRLIVSARIKVLAAKESFSTRQDYSKAPKETKPQKIAFDTLEKLTNLLADSEEKQQLAEHIHQLLQNHFNTEDGAVIKKLTSLSKELVDLTKTQRAEVDKTLSDQAEKIVPINLKNIVKEMQASILGEFETPKENISVKYYAAVDKVPIQDKEVKRILNMAFITIKNFEANDSVRDLIITVTRRTDSTGVSKDYVRTFTHRISPANLMKNNLGVEFDTAGRAIEIVMRALKVDNVLDVIEPSQIPVRKRDIKYQNENIQETNIDEDNGVITFYLSTNIQDADAAGKVLQDIFVETKKIIKAIHPRNRNPIKATTPKARKVKVRDKKGSIQVKNQYFFKIMFSKPEQGAAIELPRDRMRQFMKLMDIESPESAKEFNLLLKRFVSGESSPPLAPLKETAPTETKKSSVTPVTDDEEGDEEPVVKNSSTKKSIDDDEEDETPVKKTATKAPAKNTKPAPKKVNKVPKRVVEEDEEEDEEPVKKSSTKKPNRFLKRRPMS